jgi:hypothetical protein
MLVLLITECKKLPRSRGFQLYGVYTDFQEDQPVSGYIIYLFYLSQGTDERTYMHSSLIAIERKIKYRSQRLKFFLSVNAEEIRIREVQISLCGSGRVFQNRNVNQFSKIASKCSQVKSQRRPLYILETIKPIDTCWVKTSADLIYMPSCAPL